MFKIQGATVGPSNTFRGANPSLAIPATIVTADWLNIIQAELVALVEGAGLTLDSANNAQLLAAVRLLGTAKQYQAVVGSGAGCTHATLAAAIADAAILAGSKILVTGNETINTAVSVSKANLSIEFMPGVTFTRGTAAKALDITASGVRVRGGRFSGFNTVGDIAVNLQATAEYCTVSECRFASCLSEVTDSSTSMSAAIFGNITE